MVNPANTPAPRQQPLLFTENKGQVADLKGNPRPDVLFTTHAGGMQVFVTATGIHYQFSKTNYPQGYEPDLRKGGDLMKQAQLREQITTATPRFTLALQGANPNPRIRKEAPNALPRTSTSAIAPAALPGCIPTGR